MLSFLLTLLSIVLFSFGVCIFAGRWIVFFFPFSLSLRSPHSECVCFFLLLRSLFLSFLSFVFLSLPFRMTTFVWLVHNQHVCVFVIFAFFIAFSLALSLSLGSQFGSFYTPCTTLCDIYGCVFPLCYKFTRSFSSERCRRRRRCSFLGIYLSIDIHLYIHIFFWTVGRSVDRLVRRISSSSSILFGSSL